MTKNGFVAEVTFKRIIFSKSIAGSKECTVELKNQIKSYFLI